MSVSTAMLNAYPLTYSRTISQKYTHVYKGYTQAVYYSIICNGKKTPKLWIV